MRDEVAGGLREVQRRAGALLGPTRLVDMSVRIYVVRQDITNGAEVISGMAPVSSVATHDIGGIWDRATRRYVGYSDNPKPWYANERAIDLILHGDDMPRGVLCFGAMGSGKTRGVLAQWILARILELGEFAPIESGLTAPTDARLEEAIQAIRELARPDWYHFDSRHKVFNFRNGTRLRCVGTTRKSKAEGSRIQGFNWAVCASDEIQDQVEENANIDARGRRAPHGRYRRIGTATAKDSSEWRTLRTSLVQSGQWLERRMEGSANPFVFQSYWDDLKGSMSDREYRQIVLAQMLGPERATYPAFVRDVNVRPRPQIGSRDITLATVGFHGLVGHDPGASIDVSLLLRKYRVGRQRECWWVEGEFTTEGATVQSHILDVRRQLQSRWDLQWPEPDEPQVLVRIDPMGTNDQSTHANVYAEWRRMGFAVKAAAYSAKGKGTGVVQKNAGIEMVNRLLCNALGESRLYIDCDDNGRPVAPRLVEALEMSARDESDKAETERKGTKADKSHWCAALRYALWPYERNQPRRGPERERLLR